MSRGQPTAEEIAHFLSEEATRWLRVPNVVGVSIGEKRRGGVSTGEAAVVFDVVAKLDRPEIVRADSRPIPSAMKIGGREIPTDIVEGWPEAHDGDDRRHGRFDPVLGGISIGNRVETGTLGAILRHVPSGRPVALSNWHVLANGGGRASLQPGPRDADIGPRTALGDVIEPVLDGTIDAALSTIVARGVDARIAGLDVAVEAVAAPEPGMRVVKAGRSTGVTHGILGGPKVIRMRIPGFPERHQIEICTISPDPDHLSAGPISANGDSGACWMLKDAADRATGTMVGLHVGGDLVNDLAYACDAERVFARLKLSPLGEGGAAVRHASELVADAPGRSSLPHLVIARSLIVRGGPGTDFENLGSRRFGEEVRVIGSNGDWRMVDLEGDGRADGFMLGMFLEAVPPD